jgi:hypothetical protein
MMRTGDRPRIRRPSSAGTGPAGRTSGRGTPGSGRHGAARCSSRANGPPCRCRRTPGRRARAHSGPQAEQARERGAHSRVPGAGQHHRAGMTPRRSANGSGYRLVTAGYEAGVVLAGGIANLGKSTNSFRSCIGWDGVKLGRRGSVGPTACPGQVVSIHRAPGQRGWFPAVVAAARTRAQQRLARSGLVHEIAVPPLLLSHWSGVNVAAKIAAGGPLARDALAVTSWVTDDPVVGGSRRRYSTASDFMFPLALSFGKCQNQMP